MDSLSSSEAQSAIFPTAYSVLSMDALRERVLIHYELDNPVTCKLHIHGFSDHYLVQTSEKKWMLRIYQAPRTPGSTSRTTSDILYEVDLLQHLQKKGIAVSVPVARKDGTFCQCLQAAEGPRHAVLFTYLEGEELSPPGMNEARSKLYGRAIAEMHNAGEDFISSNDRISLDTDFLIDTALKSLQPVLEQQKETWMYLVEIAQRVKKRIHLLAGQGLEFGVCHGDAQGGNAFIDRKNTITFFDFDMCGPGWRAYELSVFRWAAALGKSRLGWSNEKIEQIWAAYIKGYQERRTLHEIDKEAIPLFVIARHFWFLGANAANWDYWSWKRVNADFFGRELEFLQEWIKDNVEVI